MSGAEGVLVIGFGNPGRLDDGLGPALAAALEALAIPGVTVDCDYQLTVEMADEVARHRVVVFADADVAGPEPFGLKRVRPGGEISFSTHSVAPGGVMALAEKLFSAQTTGYILGIRGYEFNQFGQRLSERARANLTAAVEFLRTTLTGRPVERIEALLSERAAVDAAADGDRPCKTEST